MAKNSDTILHSDQKCDLDTGLMKKKKKNIHLVNTCKSELF